MGFLRRLLGGEPRRAQDERPADAAGSGAGTGPPTPDEDVERDRELLREDARRLDDDLLQRQLRYADRSWVPTRQGGDRRADDEGPDDS